MQGELNSDNTAASQSARPHREPLPKDHNHGSEQFDAMKPEELYFNRELSWLEFNRRVLALALDDRTPLLERVFFLSIFTSNLDEFFMKRVGGLHRQIIAGVHSRSMDGLNPSEQLTAIRKSVLPMLSEQARCFKEEIMPALAEADVHLLSWDELTAQEQREANEYYRERVFPVLTPLAVDMGHPFPFISNLSLSLAFVLNHPGKDEHLFARVKIPEVFPRWIRLTSDPDQGAYRYANLVEVIKKNAKTLFHNMEIKGTMLFRFTRNADAEHDEEDAEDLLELIAENIRQRRFARVIRLEHEPNPDPWMLQFLLDEMELEAEDVYEMPAMLDYTDLNPIARLPLSEYRYESWTPRVPPILGDDSADMLSIIQKQDILVHHPYESFDGSVERFIRTAARDRRVVAIKVTLYRTGDDSPLVETLIKAAESGKQVVCMVELQARFDERRNIDCAQRLENAGVHVVYGISGLKTHTKTSLVIRNESNGLRCYAHIGTGNYHVGTARLYTDLGLFTTNPEITNDLVELFHYITGRSMKKDYRKLLVAPVNMRDHFEKLIQQEIDHYRQGKPAHIVAKMNSLQDRKLIQALYRASMVGVPVDLIVRGFCCLRPGIPGVSQTIRVISVVGRFLEHARIFHFRNGMEKPEDGLFSIGSADWMYRNLERRVEAITPIEEPALKARLWDSLEVQLNDRRDAWELQDDGSHIQFKPDSVEQEIGTHLTMMRITADRHARESANE